MALPRQLSLSEIAYPANVYILASKGSVAKDKLVASLVPQDSKKVHVYGKTGLLSTHVTPVVYPTVNEASLGQAVIPQRENAETAVVIIDGAPFETTLCANNNFRLLALNNNSLKTSLVLVTPFPVLPPTLQAAIDYVFVFRDKNEGMAKKIYEQCGKAIPTFEAFKVLFDALNPNSALVFTRTSVATFEVAP